MALATRGGGASGAGGDASTKCDGGFPLGGAGKRVPSNVSSTASRILASAQAETPKRFARASTRRVASQLPSSAAAVAACASHRARFSFASSTHSGRKPCATHSRAKSALETPRLQVVSCESQPCPQVHTQAAPKPSHGQGLCSRPGNLLVHLQGGRPEAACSFTWCLQRHFTSQPICCTWNCKREHLQPLIPQAKPFACTWLSTLWPQRQECFLGFKRQHTDEASGHSLQRQTHCVGRPEASAVESASPLQALGSN
mmetsp:Transcript_108511/g.242004  ORF Transcript_108511/g.242004 Transcript_108511/m.242004 type:complete len:257 (+) Transcript_108511:210-980(+)